MHQIDLKRGRRRIIALAAAVGVAAAATLGQSEPTGTAIADATWRGIIAACIFAAAGTRSWTRVTAAAVGVAALTELDGLLALPLWVAALGVMVWVRRPPNTWVAGAVGAAILISGASAAAGWQAADELRTARQELSTLQVAEATNVDELDASLAVIETRLNAARNRLDAPWAIPGRYLPLLGAHLRAAVDVIDATEVILDEIKPLRSLEVSDFAVEGGISLDKVAQTAEDIGHVADAAAQAHAIVDNIGRGWLVPWFENDLDDAQQLLADGAADAARVSRLLDGVWRQAGGERPQRWFVLLCSPVESRASCGFPGNYVELLINDGRFEIVETGRIRDLEEIAAKQDLQLTIGGDYQTRYQRFGVSQTWRNLTVSAHWPHIADAIRQLYGDMTGRQVDVVAGVNTFGLQALLTLTGPVETEALGRITTDNMRQITEIDQYTAFDENNDRIDALAGLTDVLVDALLNVDSATPAQLRTIADAAALGGIVVHAADDPEQLFNDSGIDGALPEPAVGVTWQNAAANKLDAYIATSIAYRLPDATAGCIVFTMRNDTPDGLSTPVIGPGTLVAPTTQRSWVSFYSPTPLQSLTVDGEPAAFGSDLENGTFASALFVDIAQGETVTIVAHLAPGAGQSAELRLQPASIATLVIDQNMANCPP